LLKAQLVSVDENLSEAESMKREYGKHYSIYLQQAQSDYDFIREQIKREQEKIRKAEQHDVLQEQEEQTHHINRWVK